MREDLKRLGLAARQDLVRHRCLTSVVRSDSRLGEVQLMMQRARWFRSSVNLVPAPERRVGSVAASPWSGLIPETGALWPMRASRCIRFTRPCRGSKSTAVLGERKPSRVAITGSDQQGAAGWGSGPAADIAAGTQRLVVEILNGQVSCLHPVSVQQVPPIVPRWPTLDSVGPPYSRLPASKPYGSGQPPRMHETVDGLPAARGRR